MVVLYLILQMFYPSKLETLKDQRPNLVFVDKDFATTEQKLTKLSESKFLCNFQRAMTKMLLIGTDRMNLINAFITNKPFAKKCNLDCGVRLF